MESSLNEPVEQEDIYDEEDIALEPIAIVGMTGRFPGASNVKQFWENVRDGVESVRIFSEAELKTEVDETLLKNPNFVGADAVLDDIDQFDAEFFGYSPREAEIMDPQHRLFLECAWEVMELAGYDPETFPGEIGVYAGANMSSYLIRNLMRNREFVNSAGSFHTMLGNSQDFLATKVSYKLNLKGPSVNTNTLCSSSMVGLHMGCQALWNYQIDMAMAGGVSIQVSRNEAMFYQEGGIGAFDGHCRAFDARARGTVSGSGLGVVLLRRLEDAIADGDTIHAVIRGSAINNDGGGKMSYTAPSIEGQSGVIAEAQTVGGIDPDTITYIEAHGTGTSLGDPIEIAGLTKAFRGGTERNGFCAVGSVKTNIGHLVTAGGVASLIKTVEALKHRQIPPSLNYEKPNPQIDFANTPFYVVTKLTEWQSEGPRRAGVSSFGIGGTNAHAVVEQAPETEPSQYHRNHYLLPFSARSESALQRAIANLADHLEANPELDLGDVASTLQIGRKPFGYRHFSVFANREEAVAGLKQLAEKEPAFTFQESEDRPVVFMFSGQGSQYPDMGRDLYEREPVFREWIDRCAELLQPHLGLDLRGVLYPAPDQLEAAAERLTQTAMTQPALFVVEYSLARMWMAWGVQPKSMIGHSIGEYVAACLAGVFSLEAALELVAARGRMIQSLPAGDMLAVPLSEQDVAPYLDQNLSLAVINGPTRCVVSGTAAHIEALATRLKADKVACSMLHTSHAFHSHMMAPIVDAFTELVAKVELNPPEIAYVSNVTGAWISDEQATDPGYWARHLRGTVRFSQGLNALFEEPDQVLLEVGPGRTLFTLARQHADQPARQMVIESMRAPRAKQADDLFLVNALGNLWLWGVRIDWRGYHEHERSHRIPLPTYPFERRRYWIEPNLDVAAASAAIRMDAMGGRKPNTSDWFYLPAWKRSPIPTRSGNAPGKHACLVFADETGPSRALSDALVVEGLNVITVNPGARFAKIETGLFSVRQGEPEDYEALFDALAQEEFKPQTVIHAWSFDAESNAAEPNRDRGLYSLLFLARSLGKRQDEDSVYLTLVSNGLQDLTGDTLDPEKAAMLGPLNVISREYPNIHCRALSFDNGSSRNPTALADRIAAELWAGHADRFVAYLGRDRWVRNYEPAPLNPTPPRESKRQGVYLLLGGWRGAGLAMAEHLASSGEVKLILADADALPEPAQWDDLPASDDPVKRTIKKLKQLQKAGAELEIARVDPTSEPALRTLVTRIEQQHGPLTGVVHATGSLARNTFRTLAETGRAECESVYAAKVESLQALETVLGERELEFCIVFTSLSTVLGGLGLGAYTAANSFAEAFVRRHNRDYDSPWLSLALDFWQTGELPAGSAVDTLVVRPEEGDEVFCRVTGQVGYDRLIVAPEDLNARLEWLAHRSEESDGERSYTVHPRPNLQSPYKAPSSETERQVAEIWQERLGIESVGVNDNFFELGGDSLIVVKIRRAMEERFGVDLLTSDLFEHPTVGAVAAYLDQEQEGSKLEISRDRAERQLAALEEEEEELQMISQRRRSYDD